MSHKTPVAGSEGLLTHQAIWQHLDNLTKPPGSLGRLEELAARLCLVQQTLAPQTVPRRLVLFAADHGVTASGVTAWPAEVTGMMVENIRTGGAASAVLARQTRTDAVLVNVGVLPYDEPTSTPGGTKAPLTACGDDAAVRYHSCPVRAGTRNMATEPALTRDEFEQALAIGRQQAVQAAADGMCLVAAGEMGIGNTTASACLAMLLADVPLSDAVGRGAGADDVTLNRKRGIVQDAVERARRRWPSDPVEAIASVAGLEIVAMAGLFLQARAAGLTMVLDGYVASAAALIAEHLGPGTAASLIASHLSAEPGHRLVLERLGLTPALDWNLRLGEGTGALLLMPLLDAAAAITCHMATFQDLGISNR